MYLVFYIHHLIKSSNGILLFYERETQSMKYRVSNLDLGISIPQFSPPELPPGLAAPKGKIPIQGTSVCLSLAK